MKLIHFKAFNFLIFNNNFLIFKICCNNPNPGINGHNHEHNQTLPSDLGKIKLASDLEEVSQGETFDPMTFNLPVGPVIGLIQGYF